MKGTIAVKARLLDQSKIAGVGNLLADEGALAGQGPARGARRQPPAEGRRPSVPRPAVRHAVGDRQRRRAHGDMISARHAGGTCPRCGAVMKHGTVGGRSTWWCSREQADRART